MPFVNIKITRDGVTPEQKAEVIRKVTQLMVDVLGKNPATTMVLIEEVETDMLITSAPRRLPASSNEVRVRVEDSKNRFINVLPRSNARRSAASPRST